jgi:hypothetical protein
MKVMAETAGDGRKRLGGCVGNLGANAVAG